MTNLWTAVDAVSAALFALAADPTHVGVLAAVDQADAQLAELEPDLTALALRRLVTDIEHCHRAGVPGSPLLDISRTAATVALIIDSRWVTPKI